MMRFKQYNRMREENYLVEGKYPNWVKISVGLVVLRIRNLSKQIERERNIHKQNILIAKQNKLISFIGGLGIGIDSDDPKLMNKLKSLVSVR